MGLVAGLDFNMKENEESRTPRFWPEPQGEKSGAIY